MGKTQVSAEADEYSLGTSKECANLATSAPTREPADSHRSNETLHTTKGAGGGDKMLTSSPNKHTTEQTSRYIMQSASFIVLMDRVGGMAFITLLQEIPQGAGGTPEDHQVLCISDQCLRHAWNLRSAGPRLLLERGSPASTGSLCAELKPSLMAPASISLIGLLDGGMDIVPWCVLK